MTTGTGRSSFTSLSRQRCEELLAEHTVGRVGLTVAGGPLILPVSYQFRQGRVVFRTSPYGPLAGLSERTRVAFEVDAIDEVLGEGWSVLVQGSARAVVGDHDLVRLWEDGPQPWAPGSRTLFVAVEPASITGRAASGA